MTQTLNRWLPPFTLAIWGSMLLYFYLSGRIAAFLHPNFRPGVLVAGVVLMLLAAGAAYGGDAVCCDEESSCSHSLGRFTFGKVLSFATLLLPLLLAFSATKDGFGLAAIENRGIITDASGLIRAPDDMPSVESFMPTTEDGEIKISVMDLLYAAQEPMLRQELAGKPVEVIGQLMEESDANPYGNRMKLVRMYMNCCAADARPVGAIIEVPSKVDVPTLSWVVVKGTLSFPMEGGKPLAVLKVRSLEPTDPPDETMLY